jgi:hypothetical protein
VTRQSALVPNSYEHLALWHGCHVALSFSTTALVDLQPACLKDILYMRALARALAATVELGGAARA